MMKKLKNSNKQVLKNGIHTEKKSTWEENFNELRNYLDENQNKLPSYNTDEFIYQWIYKQKNRYNKGKLSQERIDLLKQLNVNFA